MGEEYIEMSRREALIGSAGALTGALGVNGFRNEGFFETADDIYDHANPFQDELPVEFKVVPDQRLKEIGRERAPEVMKKYAEKSFEDLHHRAGIDTDVNVEIAEEPVELPEDGDSIEHLKEFRDSLDEPASHGNLLLSSQNYGSLEGKAFSGRSLGSLSICGTSEGNSRYSLVGGSNALNHISPSLENSRLEEGERFRVGRYDDLTEMVHRVRNPFSKVVHGIHELAHNYCLDHRHGEIVQGEEGLEMTPMNASYDEILGDFEDEELDGRQDRWQTIYFSDAAVEYVSSLH